MTADDIRTPEFLIKEMLTCAHKQWRMVFDGVYSPTNRTNGMMFASSYFSIAYLAKALHDADPAIAAQVCAALQDIHDAGNAVGQEIWLMLTALGVDPDAIDIPASDPSAPKTSQGADLDAIAARADAATAGPWWFDESDTVFRMHGVHAVIPAQGPIPEQTINHQIFKAPKKGTPYAEYWPNSADAAFMAAARTDVPMLVQRVRELQEELARPRPDYPTADAYHAACTAIVKHRDRAEALAEKMGQIRDLVYRFSPVTDQQAVADVLAAVHRKAGDAVNADLTARDTVPGKLSRGDFETTMATMPLLDLKRISDDLAALRLRDQPNTTWIKPMGYVVLQFIQHKDGWQVVHKVVHQSWDDADAETKAVGDEGHIACLAAVFASNDADRLLGIDRSSVNSHVSPGQEQQ